MTLIASLRPESLVLYSGVESRSQSLVLTLDGGGEVLTTEKIDPRLGVGPLTLEIP